MILIPPKPRKYKTARTLPGYYRAVETKKVGKPVYVWVGLNHPGPYKGGGKYYYINKIGDYKSALTLTEAKQNMMSKNEFYKKYGHLLDNISRKRKNPSKKILWVCHGKAHFHRKSSEEVLTLDINKKNQPDILADLTIPLAEFVNIPDIRKNLKSFDEIHMKYCPRSIWTVDQFDHPGEHHSPVQKANRKFFINIYYLLKPAKTAVCGINNFDLILNLKTRDASLFGVSEEDPLNQFMSTIKDLFKVKDILEFSDVEDIHFKKMLIEYNKYMSRFMLILEKLV